ncbi:UDP-glucose 4-epimerase GalE [Caenimonas sp. SL110]|uniref:UDP-glucose 4-epimerase GalE n=1 Tax=Caenimonas sp. SL110 TaxID=1450524 RepID=UPI0006549884|nr:UDP-glucose 4-epimerase GalE [Caenimonas sp. SL110]
MKTILVTGAAGYIASHTCKALAAAGYLPVAYDSMVNGHRSAVQWGPLVEADIRDRGALDQALRTYQPMAVMHFAAFAYVGESVTNPGKYYRNNVDGSLTLLEAARDAGIGQFVFSSTCATYGVPQVSPIPEDHAQSPVNPYGASKLMVERMLRDFDAAHGLRSISLRYFNAAGADVDGLIGECHEPETHLIPLALDAAAGTGSLTVFGDDYPTPDGTCVRDYIHVDDLARAHVLALGALESGRPTTAYNLGNGMGFSVREVIETVERVTGRKVPHTIGPARAGDPPALVGDASRVRRELGWNPQHTTLEAIVETAWRWHQRAR